MEPAVGPHAVELDARVELEGLEVDAHLLPQGGLHQREKVPGRAIERGLPAPFPSGLETPEGIPLELRRVQHHGQAGNVFAQSDVASGFEHQVRNLRRVRKLLGKDFNLHGHGPRSDENDGGEQTLSVKTHQDQPRLRSKRKGRPQGAGLLVVVRSSPL